MTSPEPNDSHDPTLRSWVVSAKAPDAEFPIQNLPFAVYSLDAAHGQASRCGVAIGDQILEIGACEELMGTGFERVVARACRSASLNDLMRLGPPASSVLRRPVSQLLAAGSADREAVASALSPLSQVKRDGGPSHPQWLDTRHRRPARLRDGLRRWRGRERRVARTDLGRSRPLRMEATGEQRSFLEDGDEVIVAGRCERQGFIAIGFGACRAAVLPHLPL